MHTETCFMQIHQCFLHIHLDSGALIKILQAFFSSPYVQRGQLTLPSLQNYPKNLKKNIEEVFNYSLLSPYVVNDKKIYIEIKRNSTMISTFY